jgi:hypothetical protein
MPNVEITEPSSIKRFTRTSQSPKTDDERPKILILELQVSIEGISCAFQQKLQDLGPDFAEFTADELALVDKLIMQRPAYGLFGSFGNFVSKCMVFLK